MTAVSRALAVLLCSYLLLAFEGPLLHQLRLSFFAPDLAVIVTLWIGLHQGPVDGALTAFFLGFMTDGFVMGAPGGVHTEIMVVVFYLSRFFAARVLVKGIGVLMVTAALTSLFASLLFLLLSLLFDRTFEAYGLVLRFMGPVALVTAPFAPVVFHLLDRLDGLFTRKGRDSAFFS